MSPHLKLTTKNNHLLVVKFLENDFIDEFVPHLEKIKSLFKPQIRLDTARKKSVLWDQQRIDTLEHTIKTAIKEINHMGLNFPVRPEEILLKPNNDSRQLLNRLHRHFTTGHRSVSFREPLYTWLYGSTLTFALDQINYEKFSSLVHGINEAVHQAERYYISDPEINFKTEFGEYNVIFRSDLLIDPNQNLDDIYSFFRDINKEHFKYFSTNIDYDVWLPSGQIQGKNWWRAYFDLDDPTHWDVSLNTQYNGSFSLGKRTQALDPNLVSWLQSYGIEPGPLQVGMPLGNIVAGNEFLPTLGITDHIEKIEIF